MSFLISFYAFCCLFSGFIIYRLCKYENEINGEDLRILDLVFFILCIFTPIINFIVIGLLTDKTERCKVFPKSPNKVGLIDRIKRLNIVIIKGKRK